MKGYIYKQIKAGIVCSIRMRKNRGDDPAEIIRFLEGLAQKSIDPRLRLLILLLLWVEAESAGLLKKEA
jgi:hypothetical protein